MTGAWQDGELRVGESFVQGEGVLHGDLLVAIADQLLENMLCRSDIRHHLADRISIARNNTFQ